MGQIAWLIGKTRTKRNQVGYEKLKKLCMTYLANFTRTGNPNGDNLPPGQLGLILKRKKLLYLTQDLKSLKSNTLRR
ncbi:MAG: hypothetical protein ACTSRG_12470 [Candidatus Helarchaeota archaeon]